ncbi:MAG TPA: 50S ribosomal protein L21 [Chloroflexi bacterium]|nr:50S ribosomal protein L21 [Chloroflexota bacterium]
MKYAILQSGGKQYVAREGEALEVDRLPVEKDETVEFCEVLLVSDGKNVHVGTPRVEGALVKGRVLDEVKARKVVVFKYIPKERYRRKSGHRQRYTRVVIESIVGPKDGKATAEAKPEAEKKAPAAKVTGKKAAEAKPKGGQGKSSAKKAASGTKGGAAKKSTASTKKTRKPSEKKGDKPSSTKKSE